MVTAHALKLVPSLNLSACMMMRKAVSWYKSSASLDDPVSFSAKARREERIAPNWIWMEELATIVSVIVFIFYANLVQKRVECKYIFQ